MIEYSILNWLPVGTHDWFKFVEPTKLKLIGKKNNLEQNNDLYKKMIDLGLKRFNSFVWNKESDKVIKLIQNL